uniref:BRO1 domain-containing protein n=1 Tax=Chlamydomonas euryale TaxID=1486919 RepID=A0A7R9V661_9CHLO|mmetsp:Transcript_20385/g.60638  ORF Transcript_20385/g.60638 Transcript_20385/m.60638 type:complete len:356 (+) Transcript_20385:304-1371(+)
MPLTTCATIYRATCLKQSTIAEFPTMEHLESFEQYLSCIRQLIRKEVDDSKFKFSWSSPLSGRPAQLSKLSGLAQEHAMAATSMAAALRAAGCLLAEAATTGSAASDLPAAVRAAAESSASGSAGPLADAATFLRRAAGVFTWLADDALIRLMGKLPTDRPTELVPAASACMARICLAEAQALTAHRAGQRGTGAGITSAVHLGAATLFEDAIKGLKEKSAELGTLSERLRRYLAISGGLQRARAQRNWSLELLAKGEAGQGEGVCMDAAAGVQQCMVVAEGEETWKRVLAAELDDIEACRKRIEKERIGVYYQSVVRKTNNSLPPGGPKVLVSAIPYVPGACQSSPEVGQALGP